MRKTIDRLMLGFGLLAAWGIGAGQSWAEPAAEATAVPAAQLTLTVIPGDAVVAESQSTSEEEARTEGVKACADPAACAAKGGCEHEAEATAAEGKTSAALTTVAPADAKPLDPTAPTHKQGAVIAINSGDLSKAESTCFCLCAQDSLLVGCGGEVKEIRCFDSEGKHLKSLPLPIAPEAINVAPDGTILVAGEGRLLRLSPDGEELRNVESPHAAALQGEEMLKKLRAEIVEQQKQQVEMYSKQTKQYEQMIERAQKQLDEANAELDETKDKIMDAMVAEWVGADGQTTSPASKRRLIGEYQAAKRKPTMLAMQLKSFNQARKQWDDIVAQQSQRAELTDEQLDQYVKSSLQRKLAIASISATDDTVFFATDAPVGYGFVVWKANADFSDGKLIVKDLSGCCGQMDVQASADGVFVAENSRHRVCRYDENGKLVCTWGKGAREGVEGFGSCCNPMNLAFGKFGEVYTAEDTTGRIKRYSPSGELLSVVGAAEVVPGCKKTSIAVDRSGDHVYMLDITRHQVVRLDRVAPDPTAPLVEGPANPQAEAGEDRTAAAPVKSRSVTGSILRAMFRAKAEK
jgi:sugar lactone lactonase YvrE